MTDFRLQNGLPKATAIVRFDRSVLVIITKKRKKPQEIEFKNVEELKKFKKENRDKLEWNIEHVFPSIIGGK